MANEVIARKQEGWLVVSLQPDVCKTPVGGAVVPVPYPVVAYLDQALEPVEN
ncbi:MAG: PAAR-like domain-containing protein [Candidatus Methylacidiphilaceae bacterium]